MLQDLRYALRALAANSGMASVAILTIALGVGVNTSIFSIADGMLFRPLPYPDPGRLVEMRESDARGATYGTVARETFEAIHATNSSFEDVAFRVPAWSDTLIDRGEPLRVLAYAVSPEFLRVLRVAPLIGRTLTATDVHEGREQAVLLMHAFWRRLGGDPRLVGSVLNLEERTARIVGVLPPDFIFPTQGPTNPDFVTPFVPQRDAPEFATARLAPLLARLRPGISLQQAQADVTSVARAAESRPGTREDRITMQVASLRDSLFSTERPTLLLLLGASGFVMLIVCANLASLLAGSRSGARS